MVLMAIACILFYYRIAATLHYAVLPIIVGVIQTNMVLLLMVSLLTLLAGLLTLIPKIVNPSHPPFRVVLLFRQVRIKLGLTAAVNKIDNNEEGMLNPVEVGHLLPLEVWI